MSSFYGGGGVESRHADMSHRGIAADTRSPYSRSSARPASTFHGSQSGANPGPSNPAGCLLSEGERYAFNEMMDGRYPSDDMEYA